MLKRETEAKGALSSGSDDDDEDIASSPKGALSQSSPNKIVWRNKNLKSGMSESYANHRDKNRPNATGFDANRRRYDERSGESTESEANQGSITQLSEQISTLNDRIDEFTSRIEELSSRLSFKKLSPSQQNMALHSESCNGSAPTSYFISSLSNGSLTGAVLPNSSSSSQLVKDAPLMEEILTVARGQRQILHKLDNLSNFLRENLAEKPRGARTERRKRITSDLESATYSAALALSLTLGGLSICLYKGYWTRT